MIMIDAIIENKLNRGRPEKIWLYIPPLASVDPTPCKNPAIIRRKGGYRFVYFRL